jgi:hypothetical protein
MPSPLVVEPVVPEKPPLAVPALAPPLVPELPVLAPAFVPFVRPPQPRAARRPTVEMRSLERGIGVDLSQQEHDQS